MARNLRSDPVVYVADLGARIAPQILDDERVKAMRFNSSEGGRRRNIQVAKHVWVDKIASSFGFSNLLNQPQFEKAAKPRSQRLHSVQHQRRDKFPRRHLLGLGQ